MAESDSLFLRQILPRLNPGVTVSPRDPARMAAFFASLDASNVLEANQEGYIAERDGEPLGLMIIWLDADHFTGHARAHVEVLVVAESAEGQGVGRALLAFADQWGRDHDCREVVLNVFSTNTGAIAFYERLGFAPDHLRMSKTLA
ncbi:MAG: GNAT family N-acetyltransferase [Thermomicrobiales bacterium]